MTRLNPERRLERFLRARDHQAALARDEVSDRELITKRFDDLERRLDVLAEAREH
jgi:hypothetical protein